MKTRVPMIALLGAALVTLPACGLKDRQAQAERLEHDGVSIELPPGWDGRVLALDYPAAVIQAANFELLPPDEIELPPGEQDPIKGMTGDDALVTILPCGRVDREETARPAPEPILLSELRFLPPGDTRVPRGHAFAQGSFVFADRCLRIAADFGGATPTPTLTTAVDDVLSSLAVAGG